jgi:hypothetical protein
MGNYGGGGWGVLPMWQKKKRNDKNGEIKHLCILKSMISNQGKQRICTGTTENT